jgi:branched-chain amino acid transport system ATP-binding protein
VSLLSVHDIGITFGGVRAVDGVSFNVNEGEIFAIIGPNGAGKTTLFNIISGVYRPQRGRVTLANVDVTALQPHLLAREGLSRTFQNLQVFFRMTALENVMVGRHLHESHNIVAHLFPLPSVRRQNSETREKAEELLDFVGLTSSAGRVAGELPYGALRRLEIARALATQPTLLLLDEPAAGCNTAEADDLDALIQRIAATGVTVILVEHNMKLVMKISSRIHVLDQGRTLAEGQAADIRANEKVIAAYLGTAEAHHAQG